MKECELCEIAKGEQYTCLGGLSEETWVCDDCYEIQEAIEND